MPEEDVVAQDEAGRTAGKEAGADDKRLREPFWAALLRIGEGQSDPAPVTEKLLEAGQIARGGDDEDVPDARHHQRGQRVVDHGLVVHGEKLLADGLRGRIQPGSGPSRQNDALHRGSSFNSKPPTRRYELVWARCPEIP